jgi:hypothetical protein
VVVSADIDGYLNFYAVDGCMKNTILCRIRVLNEAEQIASATSKFLSNEPVYFPIRALDFDPETETLWTGDDVGYMARWDVS